MPTYYNIIELNIAKENLIIHRNIHFGLSPRLTIYGLLFFTYYLLYQALPMSRDTF